jgi:amino acid adenylation domain-containing protein
MSKAMTDVAELTPQQRTILELMLKEKRAASAVPRPAIETQSRDTNTFPLSFGQQRLWFVQGLAPDSYVYNIPHSLRFKGKLNVSAFEAALNEIVRRHEILRTTFIVREAQPIQVISAPQSFTLTVYDLSGLEPEVREAEALSVATSEARYVFDLENGPLFRTRLLRLADDDFVFLVCMHHIICDGWSLGVFYRELAALYTAFSQDQLSPLAELPLQYADFACWQRDTLQGEVLEQQLGYWRDQLNQSLAPLELPTDRPRPSVQTFVGATESKVLPKYMTRALEEISRQAGTTMFMTMLAAFQTQLYLYTNRRDIVVGTATASRTRVEIEELMGFFTNTLVMRTDFSGNPSFQEVLAQVRENSLGAMAHQDLPFEKIVEELEPKHDLSYSPLFQVGFLYEAQSQPFTLPGLRVEAFDVDEGAAKWDLSLALTDNSQGISAYLEYNTDLFDAATIQRMLGHFEQLLEQIIKNPEVKLSELCLLTEAEWNRLVVQYNATRQEFPYEVCFHNLFEQQVERSPDALALCCGSEELSYAQLNAKANQLAHQLIAAGVGPEKRVALCLERSPMMVIALLAVNKAGGAYVPLNEHWPPNRIQFILDDAEVCAVLTQESLHHLMPGDAKFPIWSLDTEWPAISNNSVETPPPRAHHDNLIYVYYTSGSTGIPKGVTMSHRSLVNYATLIPESYNLRPGGRTLVHSPFSFDLTLTGLLPPLMVGAAVELVNPGNELEGVGVPLSSSGQRYSLIKITPSHLQVLSNWLGERGKCGNVDALIIGGEACPGEVLRYWQEQEQPTRMIDEYGPTETVVGCSIFEVPRSERYTAIVPIGRPISNMQMYVLDEAMRVLPAGVIGEIYIGGEGVARGYLGMPGLTAERFVPDPFGTQPGKRLYRSGDVGRMQVNGEMEYLGRTDEQVKIRGFRIELGEIESVLRQHEAVKESSVVVQGTGGDKRLVGYVVLSETIAEELKEATREDIREYLKRELPEYMVPVDVMVLDRMPLTSNGKVDRKALPLPAQMQLGSSGSYVPPANEFEKELVKFWEELLNVRPIGVTDNFFQRGGHSLLVVRLLAQVEQIYRREITISSFFRRPTIRDLIEMVDQGDVAEVEALVCLQRGAWRSPFFVVHALGGDVGYFSTLAGYMGDDQPFYGLQGTYPADLKEFISIEDIARNYVEEIVAVHPGPYHLGGYSFGSPVAFEMATQLKRQGKEVGVLALLEGGSPYNIKHVDADVRLMTIAGLARDIARMSNVKFDLPHSLVKELMKTMSLDEGIEFIVQKLRKDNLLSERIGIPWMRRFIHGSMLRMESIKQYSPEPYDGVITLFRAELNEPETVKAWSELGVDLLSPPLGWDRLSTKPLAIENVPGYHVTMVEEPHARVVGAKLRAAIDKVSVEM